MAASNSTDDDKAGADYVCTGTADQDTIAAAIDFLYPPGFSGPYGGDVLLLAGDYKVNAPINPDNDIQWIWLHGEGFASRIYPDPAYHGNMLTGTNWDSVVISDLFFDQDENDNACILMPELSYQVAIDRVWFHGFAVEMLAWTRNVEDITIRNCVIDDGQLLFHSTTGGYLWLRIIDNIFLGSAFGNEPFITIVKTGGDIQNRRIQIIGNDLEYGSLNIDAISSSVGMFDVQVFDNRVNSIFATKVSDLMVVGNSIDRFSDIRQCPNPMFVDNWHYDDIEFQDHSSDGMIVDNTITEPQRMGFLYVRDAPKSLIAGNVFRGGNYNPTQSGFIELVSGDLVTGTTDSLVAANVARWERTDDGTEVFTSAITIDGICNRNAILANAVHSIVHRWAYGIDNGGDDNLITDNDVRGVWATAGINDTGAGTVTAAANRT